ncbi:MAG TPA: helix-hairpin-helix domain-containing protein, partial [Clostridia bacterium]
SSAFFFEDRGEEDVELLAAFLVQHYPDTPLIPPEILLPAALPENDGLQEYLRGLRCGRCVLRVPQRGEAKRLMDMAMENSVQALRRRTLMVGTGQTALESALDRLSTLIGSERRITRIEAYDVSNTGTQDKAASMVVFIDGRPVHRLYRLFRIATVEGQDDFASMREILDRRLAKAGDEVFGHMPDLILVDGGAGHLSIAREAVAASGMPVRIAGMVKDRRHRTRALALADGRVIELMPALASGEDDGSSEGDGMERESAIGLMRLVTAIQDEAHRFAGSYNKKLMTRRHTRFSLEGIEGVGPARRRALIKQFGGLKGIAAASREELVKTEGMTRSAAEAVFRHFREKENA